MLKKKERDIFATFVLVLWGRIGFDSESVIQCQHAEGCSEPL